MQFKVLCGLHTQDGHVYKAGEIVESDKDLIKIFNNNGKFERVSVPVDQVESFVKFNNDDEVTDQFKGCMEMGLKVFHENNEYFVVDNETGKPVHETKITSKETVRTVLEGLK